RINSISLSTGREIGGKTREIFLYQKIILFASKKHFSCRNTWKNMRFSILTISTQLVDRSVDREGNESLSLLLALDGLLLDFYHSFDSSS
ncbi:hypothetical protein, partial [Leptospira borgpetersenii]